MKTNTHHNHLTDTDIQTYLDNDLSAQERMTIEDHIQTCQTCAQQVERSKHLFTLIESLPEIDLNADLAPVILDKIGRKPTLNKIARSAVWLQIALISLMIALFGPTLSPMFTNYPNDDLFTQFEITMEQLFAQLDLSFTQTLSSFETLTSSTPNTHLPALEPGVLIVLSVCALVLLWYGNRAFLPNSNPLNNGG